jgi:hypothetical protein
LKNKILLRITMAAFLLTGCFGGADSMIGRAQGAETIEGAAAARGAYNVKHSPYYVKHDYFKMTSHGSLTILPHFPTIQQTTEYSCGPASVVMVLKYFNPKLDISDRSLCSIMQTSTVKGTTTRGMLLYFEPDKWTIESNFTNKTPQTDGEFKSFVVSHLKNNMPILVENIDWGGHWRVIMGYDDLGTPAIADDVLILADPYDTTDHYQDGYGIEPAQRFYYMWFDAKLFPKDQQNRQWISVKPK